MTIANQEFGRDKAKNFLAQIIAGQTDYAHQDWSGIVLDQAVLYSISLIQANLQQSSFVGAHLQRFCFREANLEQSNFQDARLNACDFEAAYLGSANLFGADLSNANLAKANLQNADLSGADLRGANLANACLKGAVLAQARCQGATFSNAVYDQHTVFDDDFTPAALGMLLERCESSAQLDHTSTGSHLSYRGSKVQGTTLQQSECPEARVPLNLNQRVSYRGAQQLSPAPSHPETALPSTVHQETQTPPKNKRKRYMRHGLF